MEADPLWPGVYERLVTAELARRLALVPDALRSPLEPGNGALLAQHVASALRRAIASSPSDDPGLIRVVSLCNQLLDAIDERSPRGVVDQGDRIHAPAELLLGIPRPERDLYLRSVPSRPQTSLSQDSLFVNAPREPNLASELRSELNSADSVDLICAFIIWSGVRVLMDELEALRARGGRLRVVTTTYTGITDPRALDALARIGAEIRVSYDTRSTRLHAKSWLFHRQSGFGTAYIGSSNLTHTAIHDGLEWNVRITEAVSPVLLSRVEAAFDSYWADQHLAGYDRDTFIAALADQNRGGGRDFTAFDVVPYQYQRAMLDRLSVERQQGRWANLVVAATGTGKTVVSALDYRRVAMDWEGASLLFVAHRRDILRQSLDTFRHVMRDGAFGELFVGGDRPAAGQHVFASIQSLANVDLETLNPARYDVVIVDEFHHAEATTYARLLKHLRPRLLLGLTATPERADNRDLLHWFGGRIAVELRLWDALAEGLLCPFQYFGVADGVDLSQLQWKRSGYDTTALSNLYTGHDARLTKVLAAVGRWIADPHRMRAIGFCVSVAHARYMAARFTAAGIPSAALVGDDRADDRDDVLRRFRNGALNAVFAVDLLSEGVDIPEVDTLLMLRPTESATVFLQQLGRGLRLCEGKAGLTVLDFIGQQHRQFRFDQRFTALSGLPRARVAEAVEKGFPFLPAGCLIELDRVAQRTVLDNLRSAVASSRSALASELRRLGDVDLRTFLADTMREPEDLYRGTTPGWRALRREAGLSEEPSQPLDPSLERALGRMLHVDDNERVTAYTSWLVREAPPTIAELTVRERRLISMLHFDLWAGPDAPRDLQASMKLLWQHRGIRSELVELLHVLATRRTDLVVPIEGGDIPLGMHGRYSRNELLAALGDTTAEQPRQVREGVRWMPLIQTEVLLVTLQKSERQFSPTTMYRDYAVSPWEFHWESQSTTAARSTAGQRYIHHAERGVRILLFARETTDDPFVYLGPVRYLRHQSDRPMSINWALDNEIPPTLYLAARAAG